MTISYLTQSQLNAHLAANGNLNASVRADVMAQLVKDGIYNNTDPGGQHPGGPTAYFQDGAYSAPTVGIVQVLDITDGSGSQFINSDANLKAIVVQTPTPTQIFVTDDGVHHNDIYVALGTGHDSVNLFDGGNDTVQGGNDGDMIGGGAGKDLLLGGSGNDTMFGGPGENTLIGGGGDNYIRVGGAHQLAEAGGSGNNTIEDLGGYTGAGTSTLVAGTGNDTINGFGADTIHGSSVGYSQLNGGTSSYIESDSKFNANILNSGSVDGTADSLVGGSGSDTLFGGGGQDTLVAGIGDQLLSAGAGHGQSLMGGAGNDLLQDLYSGGTDTLTAGAGDGIQTLFGQQGDLYTSAAGAQGDNVFWVEAGNGAGSSLTGGQGNDTFHIDTKVGNDTITGGGGTDSVAFAGRSASDASITGSNGNYEITFTGGQTIETHGVAELYFGTDGTTIPLK